MKKEIYSCDRCGCELETDAFNTRGHRHFCIKVQARYSLRFFGSCRGDLPIFTSYDLCEKCRESLEEWLSGKDARA